MKFLSNLHTHTVYSDGASTVEQYVQAALQKGFVSLGFSEHSYAPYDTECCIPLDKISTYRDHLARLKAEYSGRLEIYTGIESDWLYPADGDGYDYVIGSVHYPYPGPPYLPVDNTHEDFATLIQLAGGGQGRRLVEIYYRQMVEMVKTTKPTIVGHLDLITKLNADGRYFDENSIWYRELATWLVEAIAAAGSIVEVNTGGMSRGYTSRPYPGPFMLGRLKEAGVPLTLSSDCHHADHLDFHFDQSIKMLADIGFSTLMRMEGGAFRECAIK